MKRFTTMQPVEIHENVFKLIGSDWMLVTAGVMKNFNTMTASWGGLGVLWHKNICTIYIRPQRFTYEFLEKYQNFTLSFFTPEYKDALTICGTMSGRDKNKVAEAGLTPVETAHGSVIFAEASLVMECRKIYYLDIDPANFIDPGIADNYPQKDYHRMYFGEIIGCYTKAD